MQVSFLLDENIAAPLADKLDKAGHDVERIVDVSELGEGINVTTICQYAVREGRLIVTIVPTPRLLSEYVGNGYMAEEARRLITTISPHPCWRSVPIPWSCWPTLSDRLVDVLQGADVR